MPLWKVTALSLLALVLVLALNGCAAEPKVLPIPQPVRIKYIFKPLDGAFLNCKRWPVEDGYLDLDVVSEANRGFDAWQDCWRKIEKIKELMAAP